MAGSLGGPLQLQDEGSFFVNGQQTASTHPGTAAGGISQPGTITVNQMYVQYRIPQEVRGPAIVMVHGSGHTGATYETTPDGREGWATYFARKGFPVYVVDHSGRGRSGFNPTAINRARARIQCRLAARPPDRAARARLVLLPHRRDLPDAVSRLAVSGRGASTSTPRSSCPNAEATLPGAGANTVQALGALLDKIGPAVVMVHSQSGAYGMDLVRARAIKMLRLHQCRGQLRAGDAGGGREDLLARFRCSRCGATTARARPGRTATSAAMAASSTVNAVKSAGGSAKFLLLPEAGQKGNSHMLMMDKNNLQIADLIIGWLGENVPAR